VYTCINIIYNMSKTFVLSLSSMEESHEHQQILIQQHDVDVNLRGCEDDLVGTQLYPAPTHDRLHVEVQILKIYKARFQRQISSPSTYKWFLYYRKLIDDSDWFRNGRAENAEMRLILSIFIYLVYLFNMKTEIEKELKQIKFNRLIID